MKTYIISLFYIIGFINLIINGDPDVILGCGIFGFINTKESKLDKRGFNILGVNNDSRGGDSCGIFIDGKVEYGVNKTKLYSNFFKESKLLKETNKCKIALGHCRKASVGNISLETAQPVVLYNDKKEVEFVVIHNGTIHNYKELAAKYIPDIDIKDMTDSQVMARIFYYAGYDCLEEYYGGAVFVIVDYRDVEPRVFAFKGASKQYSTSTTSIEERPFYFVQNKDTFLFSSIYTYLECIIPNSSYYTLIANQLVEIKEDDIYLVKDCDRSNCWQSSYYPSNYSSTYGYYYENFESYKQNTLPFPKEEKEEKKKEKINVTDGGIYIKGGKPLHGMLNIDQYGELYNSAFRSDIFKLWFWDGVLLYGHNEFVFLKNVVKQFNLADDDVKFCMPELLNYLSPYPIAETDYVPTDCVYDGKVRCFRSLDGDTSMTYNGTVQRFLTCKQTIYIDGQESGIVYGKLRCEAATILKSLIENKNIDISNLYKELYKS